MGGEFYNSTENRLAKREDRYRNCPILEDKETRERFLATREINEIPLTVNDTYHRIAAHEVTRFDILANTYYKNPLLWWVIAQANNIMDPLNPIPPGTLIRIPSLEALYGNHGILL